MEDAELGHATAVDASLVESALLGQVGDASLVFPPMHATHLNYHAIPCTGTTAHPTRCICAGCVAAISVCHVCALVKIRSFDHHHPHRRPQAHLHGA